MAAATTFTTWADLYTAMLNALADFAANGFTVAEFELHTASTTKRLKYRTMDELRSGLDFVRGMADLETGAVVGRTYAKNGGGRW